MTQSYRQKCPFHDRFSINHSAGFAMSICCLLVLRRYTCSSRQSLDLIPDTEIPALRGPDCNKIRFCISWCLAHLAVLLAFCRGIDFIYRRSSLLFSSSILYILYDHLYIEFQKCEYILATIFLDMKFHSFNLLCFPSVSHGHRNLTMPNYGLFCSMKELWPDFPGRTLETGLRHYK